MKLQEMTLDQLKSESIGYSDIDCGEEIRAIIEAAYQLGKASHKEDLASYPATVEQPDSLHGVLAARIDPDVKLPEGFVNLWLIDRRAQVKPGDKVMIKVKHAHDQYCVIDNGIKESSTCEYY